MRNLTGSDKTGITRINAQTFRAWFKYNLSDYAIDIANRGADCGFPFITYNRECEYAYNRFEDEIWAQAIDQADDTGYTNAMEMLADFKHADMMSSAQGMKVMMLWYMCEVVANEMCPEE